MGAQSSNESAEDQNDENVQYTELERQMIEKSKIAQETVRTALEDIEKSPRSERHNNQLNQGAMRVQKHSLSIQDGVLIEQTTTEKFVNLTDGAEEIAETCTIDPDSLKNVDGPTKQRKGSSRFSKRHGSRSSFSGPDDHEEEEEKVNSTDLTTRLEETNVRMKKLSEVFNVMCDTDNSHGEANYEVSEGEHTKTSEEKRCSSESEGAQTSFNPLTRSTQVIRKECPLDEVIGSMILKPENLSSSSQFSSSVVETQSPSSPLMYKAVVSQP